MLVQMGDLYILDLTTFIWTKHTPVGGTEVGGAGALDGGGKRWLKREGERVLHQQCFSRWGEGEGRDRSRAGAEAGTGAGARPDLMAQGLLTLLTAYVASCAWTQTRMGVSRSLVCSSCHSRFLLTYSACCALQMGRAPTPRCSHVAVGLPDRHRVLFFGGDLHQGGRCFVQSRAA